MSLLWRPKHVRLWCWGMGLEHIEFQHHRLLPLTRFRPAGDQSWRYAWERVSTCCDHEAQMGTRPTP